MCKEISDEEVKVVNGGVGPASSNCTPSSCPCLKNKPCVRGYSGEVRGSGKGKSTVLPCGQRIERRG